MEQSIELVNTEEVEVLRTLSINTFKTTFEHGEYTDEDFNAYFNEAYATKQLLSELQDDNSFTYFFKDDDEIVGYFKLNINEAQTEAKGDEYLEVQRIYFLPQAQGGGRGKRVLAFATKKARELNKTKIWLGVWEHNVQAFNFYKNQGLRVTGEHQFYTGNVVDTDLIMEKNI
ncbi:GNAT family N-acetyltransferase [Staphylococcus edaphicus]|uniref:GNAT family N-acetyltransferase n=1 Tax=Staphylococcus edaphicus TaxID=1955013 RepID=A0A2C6WRG0_9STAP|nr:GNAT family N-acetyltransferase [Staphylococcus edaphicus]PHK50336.1 GNAT family N-acetyltransferase [Staphylococcus edaphicus]UQW82071.1 GNAT family N-acetyltransferase [Staphylococcus edaphicus]